MIKKFLDLFLHKDTPANDKSLVQILEVSKSRNFKLQANKIPDNKKFTLHCDKRRVVAEINYNIFISANIDTPRKIELNKDFYTLSAIEGNLDDLRKGDYLRIVEAPLSEQPYLKILPETQMGEVVISGCELYKDLLDSFADNIDKVGLQILEDFRIKYDSKKTIDRTTGAIHFQTEVLENDVIKIQVKYADIRIHTRMLKDNQLIDDPFEKIKHNKLVEKTDKG